MDNSDLSLCLGFAFPAFSQLTPPGKIVGRLGQAPRGQQCSFSGALQTEPQLDKCLSSRFI
jgi:hypothetical protein